MKFESLLNVRGISNIVPVDGFTIYYVAQKMHAKELQIKFNF